MLITKWYALSLPACARRSLEPLTREVQPTRALVVNIFSSATDSVMQKLINFSLQQHPLVLGYLALALFIGACLFACLYTLNVLMVQHAV